MTNSMKGEVPIEICGESHVLRFSFGAMRELCEHYGVRTMQEVFKDGAEWGPEDFVILFTAGLKRGSIPDATPEIVGEMLVLQEMPQYTEALNRAFNASNTGKAEVVLSENPQAATKQVEENSQASAS